MSIVTPKYYTKKQCSNKTVPYVYYLYCRATKQFYIGSRYACGSSPNKFWKDYFTSSKKIHTLISKYGKENFFYFIVKAFDNVKECLQFESELIKVFFKNNQCLNRCISGIKFRGVQQGTPKSLAYRQNQSKRLKGKQVSEKWKQSHSKTWEIEYPSGEKIVVHNLQQWTEQNKHLNLWPQNLRDVAKGKYKQYKQFKCKLLITDVGISR